MRFLAIVIAAVVAQPSLANARMHAGPNVMRGGERLRGAIAPLDGGGSFGGPAVAYSLRKLKSTYAGPGVKLRRASDNATQDINFLGFTGFSGAPLDVAAAGAFCNATTCFVDTWYDQSGTGGRNAIRAAAQQPAFVLNCVNSGPCIQATSNNMLLGTDVPHVAPVMPASFSAVVNRSAGAGGCYIPIQFTANNAMYTNLAANQWGLGGGVGGTILTAAADGVWHAGIGVIAGASSVLRVDATETTGTATGSTTADAFIPIFGANATTCSVTEVVYWGGYALTSAERAALTGNQKSFWGF